MKKFRLLLFDANVVIEISRHDLWDKLISRCNIHLADSVLNEAQFYNDDDGERHDIDLKPMIRNGSIRDFCLTPSQLQSFREQFGPVYFDKLDPGESESLAYLLEQSAECKICSADKIIYRILGCLNRSDQGISLEEILQQIGLGRALSREYTRGYREEWTQRGFQEGFTGLGLKNHIREVSLTCQRNANPRS